MLKAAQFHGAVPDACSVCLQEPRSSKACLQTTSRAVQGTPKCQREPRMVDEKLGRGDLVP